MLRSGRIDEAGGKVLRVTTIDENEVRVVITAHFDRAATRAVRKTDRITYDPDADALMLRLSDAPVEESEEVAPNVVLDFDAEGRVVGIKVLFVSDLPDANPMELAYRILKESAEKAA